MIKLALVLSRVLGQMILGAALGYALPAMAQAVPAPSAIPVPNPIRPLGPNGGPVTIFENITLTPAFSPDPQTLRGISGGPMVASDLTGRAETATGPCTGFIDQQPDHRMMLTQYFNYLSLQVQSSDDTTLVIRGPGGTWCNDDFSGKNPGMVGQWLSGTYDIWVGSPRENAYHPYVIRLTEQK